MGKLLMNRFMRRGWAGFLVGWLLLIELIALPGAAAAAAVDGLPGPLASVGWLKQNLGRADLVLVDASPASQHRKNHIPGAVLSTLFTFGPNDVALDEIERHLQSWGVGPGHQVVLYDAGGTYMATRLFWDLLHRGFPAERLAVLDGGLSKWVAEGGAVTPEATPRPAPGSVRLGAVKPDVRVRLPEFLAATADPRRNVLLEALEPNFFYGGAAYFNRGGHVPQATLMPSEDFFNADKTFKSPQQIQRMLDHLGVRRDQQVLTYCGGGGAAAVPFFALKALLNYPQVKLFQESQFGWLQDERELPVWTYGDPHLVRDTVWLKAWANPMLRAFGLSQVSVVDVRAADAFRLGHVAPAVNLPGQVFSEHRQQPATLGTLLGRQGLNPQHEAVVMSDGGLDESSALAFLLLESLGQRKVSIFLDSLERWAELGQEVVRPVAAPAEGKQAPRSAAAPMPARFDAAVARPSVFIDPGAPRRDGAYPRVYIASGAQLPARVPAGTVLHLPYTGFLDANGKPKAANDIWNILAKAGVPRYAEIVLVADTLGEAAVNYVILRMMGLADIKVVGP